MSEGEALQRIRGTWGNLDRWRRTPGPFMPWSGSELKADDTDWPYAAVSQLARFGLDVAADHLQTVRSNIEGDDLNPFSDLTLLRTALVGGAQAVWLLGPDDPDRRIERSRRLALQGYREHIKALDVLLGLEPTHVGTLTVRQHIVRRRDEMASRCEAAGQTAHYSDTEVIKEAAKPAFRGLSESDRAELVAEADWLWRSGSGASHALPHSVFGRPGAWMSAGDGQGMATICAGGSAARIVAPWFAAYHLSRTGWKLLARRGT